jgi:deazaflavin-dependent oxidoreductase (nitroreductase family)
MTQQRPKPEWQWEHLRRYLETNGEDGHLWKSDSYGRRAPSTTNTPQEEDVPTLLLTTKGRRSGQAYTTALFYGTDGGRYLLVASNGGAPGHPDWYRNLVDEPNVEVQVKDKKFAATARTAIADEKPALWQKMVAVWPAYDEYQSRTEREIPLVIIERA